MLSVYVPSETSLKKVGPVDLASLPETAVWIDLVKPTPEDAEKRSEKGTAHVRFA